MTYPPGNSGYPPAQRSAPQYSAPISQVPEPAATSGGPSKLPLYLTAAVVALGFVTYLVSFGGLYKVDESDIPGLLTSASGASVGVGAAAFASLLAALLAGVTLLPKQKSYVAVTAAISVAAFLAVIADVVGLPKGVSASLWLYLIVASTLLQAGIAVAVLLFDAGVIAPPAPRPKYEQPQYGQYAPGPYYGGHHTPQQQRPGYPSQYGGYSAGPNTGGFSADTPQSGPPTPPTGFPTYGQPPAPASARGSSAPPNSSAPTAQLPTTPPPPPPPPSSPQSGSPQQ